MTHHPLAAGHLTLLFIGFVGRRKLAQESTDETFACLEGQNEITSPVNGIIALLTVPLNLTFRM